MRLLLHRPLQRALMIGFLFSLPLLMLFKIYRSLGYPPEFLTRHPYFFYDLESLEPRLSEQQTCVLPRIHPFHPSVWAYLPEPLPRVDCHDQWPEFTYIDSSGTLRFNESELYGRNYVVGKSLTCFWSPVLRQEAGRVSDDAVEFGPEIPFGKEGVVLPVDIIRVRCKNSAGLFRYNVIHGHIRDVGSEEEEEAVPSEEKKKEEDRLNVLLFGVDSLSRLSFIRLLPRTFRYLTEDLRMHVFRGMNKVGDNTFPNLIPVLTGQHAYGGRLPPESDGFDDWPLLWKNYSSAGYATMWAEDFPKFGLFNYLAKGFQKPPTMHYLRPMWLTLKLSPLTMMSSVLCYGNTPRYGLQLDYVKRFVTQYSAKKRPFFGFSFLAEVSHEYVSPVSSADEDFEEFFQFLEKNGHLEDTLLIVLSDHGHRFDAIRKTQVGHVEERMPFFAVHVPEKLLSKFPDVEDELKVNEGRLVTPFDTHATLSDLLDHVTRGTPLGSPRQDGTLGTSLFGPISTNRTCSDASIPIHLCVCESEKPLSLSDPRAGLAAAAVIEHLNRLLVGREESCSHLGLGQLKSAYLVRTPEDKEGSFFTKVRVVLEANPGGGMFEATVQIDDHQATSVLGGDVSRINPYDGQSDCIQHVTLRKFCYCHDKKKL